VELRAWLGFVAAGEIGGGREGESVLGAILAGGWREARVVGYQGGWLPGCASASERRVTSNLAHWLAGERIAAWRPLGALRALRGGLIDQIAQMAHA
jgi:hypothetical protein